MSILEIIAAVWLLFGVFFFTAGVAGIIRLPDAFSRLHASGKVATMGILGLILSVGFLEPGSFLKLITLGFFISITAPVASHAIAKADKTYSERQLIQRDSSISEAGAQDELHSTREMPAVSTE